MTEIQQASQIDTSAFVSFADRHLTFREDTPYAVWEAVVKQLKSAEKNVQWWIGDALRFGERKYGEMYAQAVEETDYSYGTLRNAVWVAEAFSEVSSRDDRLSFRHHRAVASLEPEERELLLSEAAPAPGESKPRMSARQLEEKAQEMRTLPPDVARSVHFSSDDIEWYTPAHIVERVQNALGGIDLDPCADKARSIPARFHLTKADDGLSVEWAGKVYMNPPYGSKIGAWVRRLKDHHENGDVTAAVALVPARTDTEWFAALRDYPRCFIRGRLRFSGHSNSAPFPSCAFYLGPDTEAFAAEFSALGDTFGRL